MTGRIGYDRQFEACKEAIGNSSALRGGRRPRYRLVLPSGLLIGALPAATWHLYGNQTVDFGANPLYGAPDSLVELDRPIGLVSVAAVFVALGWLALEYWLRNWRVAWLVILGLLSGLGIGTGIAGRVITAGVYGFNFGGAFFVLGLPVIYAATVVAVGVVAYQIADLARRALSGSLHRKAGEENRGRCDDPNVLCSRVRHSVDVRPIVRSDNGRIRQPGSPRGVRRSLNSGSISREPRCVHRRLGAVVHAGRPGPKTGATLVDHSHRPLRPTPQTHLWVNRPVIFCVNPFAASRLACLQ